MKHDYRLPFSIKSALAERSSASVQARRISCCTIAFVVILALSGGAFAQSPSSSKPEPKPKPKFSLDAGDAAFWAGSAFDVATSTGNREAGPIRDSKGIFAPGPDLALKGGMWGCFKLLEWKYPERRRTIMWTKI